MVATLRLGLEGLKAFAKSIPEALPHPSILSTNWRVQAGACPACRGLGAEVLCLQIPESSLQPLRGQDLHSSTF